MCIVRPLTAETTEGYTAEQLAELNDRLDAALAALEPGWEELAHAKSLADHVTERVLAEYDDAKAGGR